jgi:hypothetical protein
MDQSSRKQAAKARAKGQAYEVLGDGDLHGLIGHAEDGDDLSDSVGSIVKEEESVVV